MVLWLEWINVRNAKRKRKWKEKRAHAQTDRAKERKNKKCNLFGVRIARDCDVYRYKRCSLVELNVNVADWTYQVKYNSQPTAFQGIFLRDILFSLIGWTPSTKKDKESEQRKSKMQIQIQMMLMHWHMKI